MAEASINIERPTETLRIAHISGQLDEQNVDQIIQEVYKLLENAPQNMQLVINFENLEYMNSKSIGYMIDICRRITSINGKVAIANPKPNILDTFQTVGLTKIIPVYDDLEKAKEYVTS